MRWPSDVSWGNMKRAVLVLETAAAAPADAAATDIIEDGVSMLFYFFVQAISVKPQFDRLFEAISEESGAAQLTLSPLKKMWRALEKTGLRVSEDLRWRADNVCDIVRCMLIFDTMEGFNKGLRCIEDRNGKQGNFCVVRVKDRLGTPLSSGWSVFSVSSHHLSCSSISFSLRSFHAISLFVSFSLSPSHRPVYPFLSLIHRTLPQM